MIHFFRAQSVAAVFPVAVGFACPADVPLPVVAFAALVLAHVALVAAVFPVAAGFGCPADVLLPVVAFAALVLAHVELVAAAFPVAVGFACPADVPLPVVGFAGLLLAQVELVAAAFLFLVACFYLARALTLLAVDLFVAGAVNFRSAAVVFVVDLLREPEVAEHRIAWPIPMIVVHFVGAVVVQRQSIQIADQLQEPEVAERRVA